VWCASSCRRAASPLDAPGRPFHDNAAREALFRAIEATLRPGPNRQLVRLPHHINDPAFAAAVVTAFRQLHGADRTNRKRRGLP
jgi:uncharacterized protein (UPF0261 family)